MKIFFISALLLMGAACSTKQVDSPAESSATTVSPYTVQPCFCMKIFKPVCGEDGVPYGNSCEAECHGNKKWTEGSCKPVK